MSKFQPLFEWISPAEAHIITETTQDGKLWLSGILMQAEVKNKNGRNYPLNEISGAVKSAQQRIIEANGIFGELDHPQTLQVNLDRVSHAIKQIDMSGTNATGRVEILNTPCGNIAKGLIESQVAIGISSRGAGAVGDVGDVSGFQFVTADLVAQPSAPDAYPKAVYEAIEMAQNGSKIMSLAEEIVEDTDHQDYIYKHLLKEISTLLSNGQFAKRK